MTNLQESKIFDAKSQTLNKIGIGYCATTVSAFEVTIYTIFYLASFFGIIITYKFLASDLTIEKKHFLEGTP